MRQRPVRPDQNPPRFTGHAGDGSDGEGLEMDVGIAVTVYGAVRCPSPGQLPAPSLADPDVTEH